MSTKSSTIGYTDLGLGDVEVTGPTGSFFVYVSLDDIHGALYHVYDDDEILQRVFAERDEAIEYAERRLGGDTQ